MAGFTLIDAAAHAKTDFPRKEEHDRHRAELKERLRQAGLRTHQVNQVGMGTAGAQKI